MIAALAALTLAGCGRAGGLLPAARSAVVRCDLVAGPGGDDRGPGTRDRPLRTARRLVRRLRDGQTGCLRTGTYRGALTLGRSHVTLRSYPGERARIVGRMWIRRAARGDTVTGLDLDGRNPRRLPSPTVDGDDATFSHDDVTTRRSGICFLLGTPGYGRAQRTRIERNRIHGCGRLPATNGEHGIYVERADDTHIVDNVIYDNADRGVQLYPDAQRTVVRGNVIDGNGEGLIFSGDGQVSSGGTLVEGNVFSNPRIRASVESWYPSAGAVRPPRGNVVRGNCLWGGPRPIDQSGGGFAVAGNVVADPRYRDRDSGDFRMTAPGACAEILSASAAPAGPRGEPPVDRRALTR